jgi:hypothetical protein
MESRLIVNPLAVISRLDGSDDFSVGGPVPGRGLDPLQISPAEHPHLHSLMTEILPLGLGDLDVEKDLTAEETSLLENHGVLVRSDNIPEQPLFACKLEDVPLDPQMSGDLVVNPTLEVHPFDLAKFRSLVLRNLSPHGATAWVNDPETEMRWGYWLGADEADLIQRLEPGAAIDGRLDHADAARLYAARILIDPTGGVDRRIAIEQAAAKFGRDRYAVLNDLIGPAQLKALQSYFRRYSDQGFMIFGDGQVPLRFAQNDNPVAAIIHQGLVPIMTKLAGVAIRPTYSYSVVYMEGAELKPHTDREACVYSFSFQLDYSPASENGVSPWALYLSTEKQTDPKRDLAVHLANGSCLAYMGRELTHYRTPLPKGHRSTSLFFHYVPD